MVLITSRQNRCVFTLAITILLALAQPGCPRPRPYGSLVASRGASAVAEDLATALRQKKTSRLIGLFTERCLRQCSGFQFLPTGKDGVVHRFRWSERSATGSLGDDLYGQLHIYKRVDRVRVGLSRLRFQGHRDATAELTLAMDGVLRDGARRSDRGTWAVSLRQSVDGNWKIDGFGADDMRTVVSTKALFQHRSPNHRDPTTPSWPLAGDPASPGSDVGPGLAVADVNGDGALDVFLPGPGLGRLLLGDGKGGLRSGTPLSSRPGRGHAAVFGDADGDGDPDLLILRHSGSSKVMENVGGGRFRPLRTPGLTTLGPARSAAWLDVDGDGRLDLLLASAKSGVRLLRNRKRGFTDDSWRLGRLPGRVVATCTGDLNGDGRTDAVLVDAMGPTRILLNRAGHLKTATPVGPTVLGRACAIADLNGDGALDVIVAAVHSGEAWKFTQPGFPMPGSPFRKPKGLADRLLQATSGSFWLQNTASGFVRKPLANPASLGWDVAVAVTDLDADGQADVVLAGGHRPARFKARSKTGFGGRSLDALYFTRVLPRQLLGKTWKPIRSQGPLGVTRGATLLLGHAGGRADIGSPAGLSVPSGVRAAVFADLDRDGTPELLLRLRNGALSLWQWRQPRGNAITLRLATGRSAAAGATVTAWALGKRASVILDGGAGGLGEVRLGLGSAARADKVEIRWPDGTRQVVQDLNTRASYTIHQGTEDPVAGLGTGTAPPTRPTTRPTPPTPPGTVAGVNLATLGDLGVTNAHGIAKKRPLKALYGKRATLVLLPCSPCKARPAYLRNLSKLGRRWHSRGVKILAIRHPFLRPEPRSPRNISKRRPIRWITDLKWTSGQVPVQSTLSRLLVLDAQGQVKVFYLAKLPDPLVLEHHLTRITAD
jgi:FG-GAP-like repeat/ASPIC and UnbV